MIELMGVSAVLAHYEFINRTYASVEYEDL